MKPQGRDYQIQALESVQGDWSAGKRSLLAVLPTGTGKTVLAGLVADHSWNEMHKRVLFVAERRHLVHQAQKTLKRFGLRVTREMGMDRAGHIARREGHAHVVVATPQTLSGDRLREWDKDHFGTIIIDECHHATNIRYRQLLSHFESARVLGITATAGRSDGKNLGRVFEKESYRLRLKDAIYKYKCLVPYEEYVSPIAIDLRGLKRTRDDANIGDLVERITPQLEPMCREVHRTIGDRQGVIFAQDQSCAATIADILNQLGIEARYICGSAGKFGMGAREQKSLLNEYECLGSQVLVCADLLIEGWDCPACSFVGVMRLVKSRFRYQQMLGRGLRPCEGLGKKDCLLLDFDWQTDSDARDIFTPVELFDDGDGLDDDLLASVKSAAKRGGSSEDLLKLIEEAEKKIRARPKIDAKLSGARPSRRPFRRNLRDTAKAIEITLKSADRASSRPRCGPSTENQRWLLRKLGVEDPEKLSKWGAGKVISNIKQREKHGLATPQQVHEMMACGISPTIARGVTKEEAVEILSRKGDQKGFDFGDSRGSDQGVPRKPRTQKGVQR